MGLLIEDDYPSITPGATATVVAVPSVPLVLQPKRPWNEHVANWLSLVATALLSMSPVSLGWLWVWTWIHHQYPFGPTYERDLANAWSWALLFPIIAFLVALLSILLKPSGRAWTVLGLSFISFLFALCHFCLLGN